MHHSIYGLILLSGSIFLTDFTPVVLSVFHELFTNHTTEEGRENFSYPMLIPQDELGLSHRDCIVDSSVSWKYPLMV